MNHLFLYIILFLLILIGAGFTFMFLLKKYACRRNEFTPKLILFSLLSTIIISIFAGIYCLNLLFSKDDSIDSLSRPNIGEGDKTVSINVDSEIYSGTLDIELQEKKLTFEEALEIFSKYRADLDKSILGDNTSFLKVTKPLNFPTSIGDENISISWYISNPNIIDYTGNILVENLLTENENLEVIATLKLGEHTAEICYSITVYKASLSLKDELLSYINTFINDEALLNNDQVILPSKMDNISLSFYSKNSSLPPIFFYFINDFHTYTIYYT